MDSYTRRKRPMMDPFAGWSDDDEAPTFVPGGHVSLLAAGGAEVEVKVEEMSDVEIEGMAEVEIEEVNGVKIEEMAAADVKVEELTKGGQDDVPRTRNTDPKSSKKSPGGLRTYHLFVSRPEALDFSKEKGLPLEVIPGLQFRVWEQQNTGNRLILGFGKYKGKRTRVVPQSYKEVALYNLRYSIFAVREKWIEGYVSANGPRPNRNHVRPPPTERSGARYFIYNAYLKVAKMMNEPKDRDLIWKKYPRMRYPDWQMQHPEETNVIVGYGKFEGWNVEDVPQDYLEQFITKGRQSFWIVKEPEEGGAPHLVG